ncbi:glycosyltransferase [Alicyclobacillus tolerans]|uniref:glycosyltransferase family 2 protein n=1 Tax=Alicyclobacillus tolerans TaxID=90970 RepID=UPI001F1C4C23|nr:glycosyltransferase family 2 protein [Alicyclobacillus tolerans]MCF8565668.1 glycosyltransferase [Alicyclobacillus tolerans]
MISQIRKAGSYVVIGLAIVLVGLVMVMEDIRSIHFLVKGILSVVVFLDQSGLLVISLYQIAIAIAGSLYVAKRRKKRKELETLARLSPDSKPRFLCLTAAHNEETVIAEHVRSLLSVEYPRELVNFVVIADNCNDATAERARAEGAVVWERFNDKERSKGAALKWAIHEQADLSQYDAVCIFDADNLLQPNFLNVMALCVLEGHEAIQAYLDTKNPWDSWISSAYASAYWYMNRFWQQARVQLGLSGALGGTGFCLTTRALRDLPWGAKSLTEDLEYTVQLVIQGRKVHWTPQTRVYDEKPVKFSATVPQRTRWLQGHWSTAFRYSKPLLRQVWSGRGANRLRAFDVFVYLWQPLVILFTALNLIFTGVQLTMGNKWYYPLLSECLPYWFWIALVVVGLFLPLVAFALEDADWKVFWRFPSFLLFNLSWIPITIQGLLSHKDVTWTHTEHKRAISIHELLNSEALRK